MPVAAKIIHKRAGLATQFGLGLACQKFSMSEVELARLLGTFTDGPYRGSIRGFVHWEKCILPGWGQRSKDDRPTFIDMNERWNYCLRIGWDANSKLILRNGYVGKS